MFRDKAGYKQINIQVKAVTECLLKWGCLQEVWVWNHETEERKEPTYLSVSCQLFLKTMNS